ncbi:MAG TPA: matrixin family metalloprotease [Chloroflexota bacterium]|jgi:hypothetical protein
MADQQLYDEGSRPHVLINWESFELRGIPPRWRSPFTSAVINAYTRWANVAGIDLRFQFQGFTHKTYASAGELLIYMDDRHPTEARLTSTYGSFNQMEIVFHRMNGEDLSPWNFVPFNGRPGEYDMQAILMHELGHCIGLDHAPHDGDTLFNEYDYHAYRFGPFSRDVTRARHIYPDFTRNRLRQMRSTDGGATWSPVGNELTTYNHLHARTNTVPGVVGLPPAGMYVVGWTLVNGSPTWLRGDGGNFLMRNWEFFGAEQSIYGPAMAGDGQNTIIAAWVQNDDAGTIKVLRSRDQGYLWQRVGTPAGAQTYGTPGLAHTRVDGQLVWILVWTHFDRTNQECTGCIRYSLSRDDGHTWTPPEMLDPAYKALAGVSVAADNENHVLVSFAWAPHSTQAINRIRTFACEVIDGHLRKVDQVRSDDVTRLQPALTFDESTSRFILAWRDQNFVTSLTTARTAPDQRHWSDRMRLDASSNTAPALASMPSLEETVLWYAAE